MSSMIILPPEGSTSLKNTCINVDLPLPVRPTTPTFSPPLMLRVIPLRTKVFEVNVAMCRPIWRRKKVFESPLCFGWNMAQNMTPLRDNPYESDRPTTMKRVDKHKMMLPSSSNLKPNHSFDPLLWKSIRKLAFTLLRFSLQKLPCFRNDRMVPLLLNQDESIHEMMRGILTCDDEYAEKCNVHRYSNSQNEGKENINIGLISRSLSEKKR
ncbi:hypothetical protein G4B88_010719 [Cannabis sativa]|uniref:Uncharacterized protein n=1 Tax=Cannabis sativa TaxID=3483 RepID=A0A7J6F7H6_CANSA|nr:hypothetical protein G4B88_010719 [Cannabis sativa]